MSLRLDDFGNWVTPARWCLSPNHDTRPPDMEIDLLVVHCISLPRGEFGTGYPEALFRNELRPDAHPSFQCLRDLRVSAHVLVDRRGSVTQFVPFRLRAWHAGESCFAGRRACNDFSIGIELEGVDDGPFEACQYEVLADLILGLMVHYPGLSSERLVGHSDIAPGRKTDPGPGFQWNRLNELLCSRQRT